MEATRHRPNPPAKNHWPIGCTGSWESTSLAAQCAGAGLCESSRAWHRYHWIPRSDAGHRQNQLRGSPHASHTSPDARPSYQFTVSSRRLPAVFGPLGRRSLLPACARPLRDPPSVLSSSASRTPLPLQLHPILPNNPHSANGLRVSGLVQRDLSAILCCHQHLSCHSSTRYRVSRERSRLDGGSNPIHYVNFRALMPAMLLKRSGETPVG